MARRAPPCTLLPFPVRGVARLIFDEEVKGGYSPWPRSKIFIFVSTPQGTLPAHWSCNTQAPCACPGTGKHKDVSSTDNLRLEQAKCSHGLGHPKTRHFHQYGCGTIKHWRKRDVSSAHVVLQASNIPNFARIPERMLCSIKHTNFRNERLPALLHDKIKHKHQNKALPA